MSFIEITQVFVLGNDLFRAGIKNCTVKGNSMVGLYICLVSLSMRTYCHGSHLISKVFMVYISVKLVWPFLAKSAPFSFPCSLQIFAFSKIGLFAPWFGKLCSFSFPTLSLTDMEIWPQSVMYPMLSGHIFLTGERAMPFWSLCMSLVSIRNT